MRTAEPLPRWCACCNRSTAMKDCVLAWSHIADCGRILAVSATDVHDALLIRDVLFVNQNHVRTGIADGASAREPVSGFTPGVKTIPLHITSDPFFLPACGLVLVRAARQMLDAQMGVVRSTKGFGLNALKCQGNPGEAVPKPHRQKLPFDFFDRQKLAAVSLADYQTH